jgi:RNA-directed DNA polymerase
MQAKLHHWAAGEPGRRFDDLFNLVCHQGFLTVAGERVRGNKGARTAGVDPVVPWFISEPLLEGAACFPSRASTFRR